MQRVPDDLARDPLEAVDHLRREVAELGEVVRHMCNALGGRSGRTARDP
jgi:hypothetical protein